MKKYCKKRSSLFLINKNNAKFRTVSMKHFLENFNIHSDTVKVLLQ